MSSIPDFAVFTAHLFELRKRLNAEPQKKRQIHIDFYEAMKAAYGEEGAHFALLVETMLNERVTMNVNITNSTVGNINLGQQLGEINTAVQTLSASQQKNEHDVAQALKELTEKVMASDDLAPQQKKDAVELLAELAKQTQKPESERSSGVIRSVLGSLGAALSGLKDVGELWTTWAPIIKGFFGT